MRGSARHLTLAAVIGPRGLRWSLLCLLAVVGLPVVAAADAQAGFEFLAVRWDLPPYGDKLYRLSVEHSASGGYYFTSEEEIGPLGYPISGTAQGRSGTLYALDPWDRILLRVDRSTGAASPLVTLDI